jgi:hypothetical protein
MSLPADKTAQTILRTLEELWPELEVEIEALDPLVILTARLIVAPSRSGPAVRLVWIRGEGHVVGSIHPRDEEGTWTIRFDFPSGDPKLVVEAAVKELRSITGLTPRA